MQYLEGGCSIPLGVRSEFLTTESEPRQASKNDANEDKNEDKKEIKARKGDTKEDAKKSDPKNDSKDDAKESDTKEDVKNDEVKEPDTKSDKISDSKKASPPSDQKRTKAHLDAIVDLKLSGVVISLDGQRCVQFDCKLQDVDLDSMEDSGIDCTKIVLPTSECPKQSEVKEQYISCAKLGIHLAKQLQTLGARSILDEINKSRKPVSD